MTFETEAALIESILYLENEPVDLGSLSRISGLSRDVVRSALDALRVVYEQPSHGLELCDVGGGFSLGPKERYWQSLRQRYGRKNDNRLSKAALETLSIVAYSQPVTRAEIEGIRGVSADGMIRLLMARELVGEVGKKEAPGRPIQYGTTREFLRVFRLASIADLPKLDEVDSQKYERQE